MTFNKTKNDQFYINHGPSSNNYITQRKTTINLLLDPGHEILTNKNSIEQDYEGESAKQHMG